jgi:hypothetical protein
MLWLIFKMSTAASRHDTGSQRPRWEVIKSASATKAGLTQYWSQHNNHGLRVVNTTATNTTATTLYTFSGRPYAIFTVDATDKITGLPVHLVMIYDVNSKVMYASGPTRPTSF